MNAPSGPKSMGRADEYTVSLMMSFPDLRTCSCTIAGKGVQSNQAPFIFICTRDIATGN